jgi:hypothetical protein
VIQCGKEKGKGRLGDEVWQRERKKKTATLHHPIFLFLSHRNTSSPSLPFPFSLPHFIEVWQRERKKEDWVRKCGKEKGKRRLGDGV